MNTEKISSKLDRLGVDHDELISRLGDLTLNPNQLKGINSALSKVKKNIAKTRAYLYQYCESKH